MAIFTSSSSGPGCGTGMLSRLYGLWTGIVLVLDGSRIDLGESYIRADGLLAFWLGSGLAFLLDEWVGLVRFNCLFGKVRDASYLTKGVCLGWRLGKKGDVCVYI